MSEKLIIFAATLATYYSQAKDSNISEVNYTQIKNVKRLKTKGLVSLSNINSTTINVDYEIIKQYI